MSEESTEISSEQGFVSNKPIAAPEVEGKPKSLDEKLSEMEGSVTEPTDQEPEWFYSDGVKGEGARPEWMTNKYKTVADQAKGYNEIRTKLSGFVGAPEEGYNVEKFEALKDAPELLNGFNDIAKELNMSQDAYEKVIGYYVENEMQQAEKMSKYVESMTPEAKEELAVLNKWAKNNFSEKEYAVLDGLTKNPEAVEVLKKIRAMSTSPKSIPTSKTPVTRTDNKDIQKIIAENYNDYIDNKDGFRDRVQEMRKNMLIK